MYLGRALDEKLADETVLVLVLMMYIRTEDAVVHLLSQSNADLGQPLCYELSKRLPQRGSATATEDLPNCADCHRRALDEAGAQLEGAIRGALAAGLSEQEVTQPIRHLLDRVSGTARGTHLG